MASELAITVKDLRKKYSSGWFGRKVDALRGVTFDVPRGKVFGLLGPNGAGKTTIIKVLLGIVRASGGNATLLGYPAGKRVGRYRVGYLPENLQLPRHQNALSALEFYGRLSRMDKVTIRRRGGELLERVGLADRKKESVNQYSKGMRQRLGLAQALLHDPELLILDEPTDGLDPVGRSQVRDILRDLGEGGRTVFLNSHLLQEVEMVCDDVAILGRGELKYVGSISSLAGESGRTLDVVVVAGKVWQKTGMAMSGVTICEPLAEDRYRLRFDLSERLDTNQVIDTLRKQDISIVSVSPTKKTLEDLFLNVVGGPYQA